MIVGNNPVNPPHRLSTFKISYFASRFRQVFGVLDGLAIHVANIKRAVGAIGEIDWTEPIIGRGEELVCGISPFGDQGDAIGTENVAMNQVTGGFTSERV